MSLEQQILIALRRAIRDEKFDVADHLWQASEALARQSENDPAESSRLTLDDIGMVVTDELLRLPSRRSTRCSAVPTAVSTEAHRKNGTSGGSLNDCADALDTPALRRKRALHASCRVRGLPTKRDNLGRRHRS